MTGSDRWQLVERLYHDALARDERERATYLCDACGTDEALRREVESLLAYARETHGFMQVPAIDLAVGQLSPHREEHVFRVAAEAQLGPYRIIAPLGAGGMGEVYRAHDSRLGRDVALKILPSRVTRDLSAVERFSREARAASALNHPNIITIHEISEADIGRFIVMELVQGTTLRRMIPQPFALDAFAHLGSQMARALAVAHVAGIIHRDVKPENIMVRDDGYVKLLDFGLARLTVPDPAQSEGETTTNTTSGLPIGTARYMSPEQVQSGALTAATDIFSLGIVLYELATGQRPFPASSQIGVLHAILSESPQPPSHTNPEIPRTLDALILQMLEKDARLRPSASEVEAALAEIGGRRPISDRRRAVIEPARHTVGRSSERRELREAFEVAAAQRGLLVSVAGEAGIGKTTLVEDVLNELAADDRPHRIGRGGCSERLAGTEAYLPWLEALDSLLRDEGRESATRVMKLTAPSWYQLVASVKVDEAVPREQADAPGASQERLKRELVAFLQEISRQRPLVLFFDDVHWADVSTIDLLAYVATKLATLRVLVVATYRPSELLLSKHPFVAIKLELQGRGACREMPLGFLTREDVEHYLALECPEHDFPTDLPALIHAKTEGNPLFMVDLVRHLRSSQVIAEKDGRWILAQSVPDLQRELPQSVRSMIQKKIAQLGATDLRLLVAASVQGYEFDSAVVAKALGADAADVEERLDVLERVHFFVRLVSERELPDRTVTLRYRFVHVLYQNALYESLRPTRRMSLSAAIAEALLAYQTKDRGAVASEVAMLFQAARDFERAAEYFLLSAEHATQAYAVKEAVALARHGLDALAMLPETPERAQQKLSLQTALGRSLMATVSWGSPEAAAVYTQARDLYQQVGQTSQLFPIIWGLWQYRLGRAEYQAGRELADHLAALARELDNPAFNLLAHQAVGQACWLSGHFEAVPVHAEQAIALYVPHDHHSLATLYGGHDPGVANRCCLAVNLWILGYPDQSLQRSREALGLAHEIGHTYSVVFALLFDAMVHQHRRDAQRVRQQAEAAVALATEQKLVAPGFLFWAATLRGWALAEQGQIDEGITQLRYGIQGFRSMSFDSLQPYFLTLLCEAHARKGHVEDALTVLAEALAITERTREGYVEAELYRLKGELLTEPAERAAAIRQAIEIARRQKAKSFELRAVISLSKLYEQEGPQAEARQMLSEIHGWFREGFDTADLKEAAAMLERF